LRVRAAILDSLRHLTTLPEAGRRQSVEGVRKLTTRRYRYIVYYTVDDVAEEIAVLTNQYAARDHGHDDA
jgi:plasmid stabilization system protein ParE